MSSTALTLRNIVLEISADTTSLQATTGPLSITIKNSIFYTYINRITQYVWLLCLAFLALGLICRYGMAGPYKRCMINLFGKGEIILQGASFLHSPQKYI